MAQSFGSNVDMDQIVLTNGQAPQLSGDWTVGEILLALEQAREWVLRLQVSRAAPDTANEELVHEQNGRE